jgi:hypothetical protein
VSTPEAFHPTIVSSLDALEASIPRMIADHQSENCDFWCSFSAEADDLLESASGDAYAYASGHIDAMLKKAGIGPETSATTQPEHPHRGLPPVR